MPHSRHKTSLIHNQSSNTLPDNVKGKVFVSQILTQYLTLSRNITSKLLFRLPKLDVAGSIPVARSKNSPENPASCDSQISWILAEKAKSSQNVPMLKGRHSSFLILSCPVLGTWPTDVGRRVLTFPCRRWSSHLMARPHLTPLLTMSILSFRYVSRWRNIQEAIGRVTAAGIVKVTMC